MTMEKKAIPTPGAATVVALAASFREVQFV